MWVSWVVARQLVVGLVVVALAFVDLAVSLFLRSAAIAALDLRGLDPDVPRYMLKEPSGRDLWPRGCAPLCRDGRG